jgi:hypothetical protein
MPGLVAISNPTDTTYGVQRQFGSDMEMDLSSADNATSDRPTPSSTAPSDGHRATLIPRKGPHSNRSSYETSPVTTQIGSIPEPFQGVPPPAEQARQQQQQFFPGEGGYMPPMNGHAMGYGMAGTPGWEMAQGMTPIGEGVFRELMGIGPMDIGGWGEQA